MLRNLRKNGYERLLNSIRQLPMYIKHKQECVKDIEDGLNFKGTDIGMYRLIKSFRKMIKATNVKPFS